MKDTLVGIKESIDVQILSYYAKYYDIVRTYDFNDDTRLLTPKHGLETIGSPKNKVCRFCGRSEPQTTFRKIAHVFPEALGNNVLASNYECDICNQFFGSSIENDYAKFFSLYHTIMQIKGKRGIPDCKFKVPCSKRTDQCAEHCIEITFSSNPLMIRQCKEAGDDFITFSDHSITISKPIGNFSPIGVFKAIVKMALTVMPVEELSPFEHVIKWLLEPEHKKFSQKKLLVRYEMIPGFNVTKYIHYCLYKRKNFVWDIPYMLFHLTYGCFSLFIEIPRCADNIDSREFESMPFPPVPFYISDTGIWDLSDDTAPKGMRNKITLNFDETREIYNAQESENKLSIEDLQKQFESL